MAEDALKSIFDFERIDAPPVPGMPDGLKEAMKALIVASNTYSAAEREVTRLQGEYLSILKTLETLTAVKANQDATITAWCADYSDELSGTVATMEVPGEVYPAAGGGINIKPGYADKAAWGTDYGMLQSSIALSPAGFAWNFTMLQPWVKWMPMWRYGTASNVNKYNDTMDVTLHPILSNAQSWLAKQSDFNVPWEGRMSGVPVEYMECNAEAFENGDEVIVEFRNPPSYNPYVIGFKQAPKECPIDWPDWSATLNTANAYGPQENIRTHYFARKAIGFPPCPSEIWNGSTSQVLWTRQGRTWLVIEATHDYFTPSLEGDYVLDEFIGFDRTETYFAYTTVNIVGSVENQTASITKIQYKNQADDGGCDILIGSECVHFECDRYPGDFPEVQTVLQSLPTINDVKNWICGLLPSITVNYDDGEIQESKIYRCDEVIVSKEYAGNDELKIIYRPVD